MKYKYFVLLLLCIFTQSAQAVETKSQYGATLFIFNAGMVTLNRKNYENDGTFSMFLSQAVMDNKFIVELGYFDFGKIIYTPLEETWIAADGLSAGLSKTYLVRESFFMNASIHALYYQQRTRFLNFDLGTTENFTFAVGVKAIAKLNLLSLSGGLRWHQSIANDSLFETYVGAEFHFDSFF